MNELINNCVTAINDIGRGFCNFTGSMFIQSSVLIVLLLSIDFLIRKRVRATFRYWIWMLVFIKLVLPPTLSSPTGIGNWFGEYFSADSVVMKELANPVRDEPVAAEAIQEFTEPVSVPQIQPAPAFSEPVTPAELNPPITSATPAISAAPGLSTLNWQGIVFLFWFVGVLVITVLLIQRIFFVKGLIAQSKPAKNRLVEVLNNCRLQVGVRRNIRLRLSHNVTSPAVCGLFRPVILIPINLLEQLSREKLRAVLIHELAHIKRGDLWINCVQTFLQIAYFYNPFVWLANVIVRRIREQAVDEMVLVTLGDAAKSYSNTLIDIAEMAFSRPALSLRLVGVVESKKALSQRIKHILYRPFPKSAKLGILSLLIIIVIAAVLLPMAKGYEVTTLSGLYEKAIVSRDFKAKVGPTNFTANAVVRWKRDGGVIVTDPENKAVSTVPFKIPDYSKQATWMDIAQVYISPGIEKYEAVELRVFDHKKREILSYEDYVGIGYNIRNSVATIYSIGQLLPDQIDLWMRVIHKPAGTTVIQIPAQENAFVNLPNNTLKILEIKKGTYSYSSGPSGINWTKHNSEYDEEATSVVFQFNSENRSRKKYQICAISKNGERLVPDFSHFISSANGRNHVITIGFPKDQIDHFEITPFVSRDTFYFDDVKLPKVSDSFSPCLKVTFDINGSEGQFTNNDLSPIGLELSAYSDKRVIGTTGSADNWRNTFRVGQANEGTSGFALKVNGIRTKNVQLAYFDQKGKRIGPDKSRGGGWSSGGTTTIKTDSLTVPLEQIRSVSLQISAEKIKDQQIYIEKPTLFQATLPNGVTVELLGVCEHPSEGKQWWKPDGEGFIEPPYSKFDKNVNFDSTEQVREMAIRLHGSEGLVNKTSVEWQIPGSKSSSGDIEASDENCDQIMHTRAVVFACDVGRHVLDFRLAVAAGDWKTVASAPPAGGNTDDSLYDRTVIFYKPYERDELVVVSVAHLIDQMKTRVVVIDQAGQIHTARKSSGVRRGDELRGSTCTFDVTLDQIRSFELQVRPYEWITFKNISLEPGVKTDVQVEVEGGEIKAEKENLQAKKIFLPDVDEKGLMLDLESGDLVDVPKADTKEQIAQALDKMKKGDIVFDTSALILVRGATSPSLPGDAAEPFKTYTIGQNLPEILNVRTNNNIEYTIEIHSINKDGCQLEYYPVHPKHFVSAAPLNAFERTLIKQLLDMVRQVEEKYPDKATHWPEGPGIYHVDSQGKVTVWHYQKLRYRSGNDSAENEVGYGSSELVKATGMYYLPDGTPLQSRWRERGGGMKDIRVNIGRALEEGELVGLINRHDLSSDSDLLSRDGLERTIVLRSYRDLPLMVVVRIDRPLQLGSRDVGDIETDVKLLDDYDQITLSGPPDRSISTMLVTVRSLQGKAFGQRFGVQSKVKDDLSGSVITDEMVGTWFFDNPMGDEEQMAIFPDGRIVVMYSNGHKDQTRLENGFIKLAEYDNARFKIAMLENGTLMQYPDIETGGLAKRWRRIDPKPHTESSKSLTRQQIPPDLPKQYPITLKWSAINGSIKYIIQIRGVRGSRPAKRFELETNSLILEEDDIAPGRYQWTVSAYDKNGKLIGDIKTIDPDEIFAIDDPKPVAANRKKVLIDLSHSAGRINGWGYYNHTQYMTKELLENAGFNVEINESDLLTTERLKSVNMLICSYYWVGWPNFRPYLKSELSTIHQFVENGGSLLVVGCDRKDGGGKMYEAGNELVKEFGIRFELDSISEDHGLADTKNNQDVISIKKPIPIQLPLSVQSENAVTLLNLDGQPIVKAKQIGRGKIIVAGVGMSFLDCYLGDFESREPLHLLMFYDFIEYLTGIDWKKHCNKEFVNGILSRYAP